MLTSIAIILLLGLVMGWTVSKLKLPNLLGMILVGIIISPYALNLIDDTILGISSELRQIALVIILTRAGFQETSTGQRVEDVGGRTPQRKLEDQRYSCVLYQLV